MNVQWLFILASFGRLNANGNVDLTVENVLKFYGASEDEPFMARNCDTTDQKKAPIVLNSIEMSPHPIQLGRFLFVNVSVYLNKEIGVYSKIEIGMSIRLKTPLGYTELCDFVGEEFCHTNDLCDHIAKYKDRCPVAKCTCPLPQGQYNLTQFPIVVKKLPFDLYGSFETTIKISERGKHLGCIESHFCIGSCVPPIF
ncbi:ganglioside GM2 activator-like [Mercenaria mercenaria]|uniref:ganglioside GM2 activator-like n=1 Tax=Mercenaria mercenaria TaxID=6596 RepID=UPI00234F7A0A|nr:ganglioside GM2 activator-like [Mercenaria mercenaria]